MPFGSTRRIPDMLARMRELGYTMDADHWQIHQDDLAPEDRQLYAGDISRDLDAMIAAQADFANPLA